MPTLNQYPRNIQIRAINKLIAKYGHDGYITSSGPDGDGDGSPDGTLTEACRVLFGRFKISFGGGTLIINNNYKLHVKPIGKARFDYQPGPDSEIVVNGITLNVINANKVAPDGANAIVWEMEASGNTIPYDVVTIVNPTIVSPANLTENYSTTGNSGALWAVNMVSSAFAVTGGEDTLEGMDWEIATDEAFASVAASTTGYIGGTTWNTGNVLSRDTNYWARVKHHGVASGASAWSAASKFSLDEFSTEPVVDIVTPTMVTTASGGYLSGSDYHSEYSDETGGFGYKVYPKLSDFVSGTGKTYDHTHWQLSYNPAFTGTMVYEGDSVGGFDSFSGTTKSVYTMVQPSPFSYGYSEMYVRGKQVATDSTESAWSDTLAFYLD